MKTIYIVFNNREKVDVCTHLFEDLRFVFEDYISIKLCFLNEIKPGDISDGDLYLVLYKERIFQMKDYISSLENVLVMARTFERQYLSDIYALPDGTDVLVVNDSMESTYQTTNSLYELGLNHLNLIPYIPSMPSADYEHIHVAITPGEEDFVPKHIKQIINVHDRCIDTNTFVSIINKLNLNNSQVTRNLLKYIQRTTDDTGHRYITDNLKDQMLKRTIQESRNAIIITDNNFAAVHYNDKADAAFDISLDKHRLITHIFESIQDKLFTIEDYENKLIKFQDTNYIVSKSTVKVQDQIIGYSFRFSTETDIKNLEIDLNKQLVKSGLVAKYRFDDIIYHTEIMEKSINLAKKIALSDYTVLITGESGTGKELMAQSIHNFSARSDKPFVAINCAALPESLLESELFGYEKGAFTGASRQGKIGLFEQANHGTIFLDEIGDMSLNLQSRLLRVLQEKQITRIGSDKVINLDIRVLAATNKDLSIAIKQREFREDLYYRLANIPINLPPLRERKEDVLHLFKQFAGEKYYSLTTEDKNVLNSYSWPGNIRELKNAADYFITLDELPSNLSGSNKSLISAAETNLSLEDVILQIIASHTSETSGIGRVAILNQLQSRNISLSDDKLRKLLHRLEEENKITIGRGRSGCRIV